MRMYLFQNVKNVTFITLLAVCGSLFAKSLAETLKIDRQTDEHVKQLYTQKQSTEKMEKE